MKISLFCNAGMSTSLLVEKMKEATKEEGLDADIVAYPLNELDRHIEGIDVALLGPQVGYQKKKSKQIADKHNVPLDVISMTDYGRINGKAVLEQAKKLIFSKR